MGANTTGGQTEIPPSFTGLNSPADAAFTSRLTTLRYTGFISVYLTLPVDHRWYLNCEQLNERCKNKMTRLYIGNLPHVTAEHELQSWIEQQGFKVESVQVIRDLETGASRGFAFVELPEVLNVQEAVDALNGQKMEGNNLRVSEARPIPFKSEGRQAGGTRSPKKRAS